MKKPLVSIIIPTYNRCFFIEKALKSILEQTYQDFEIIIIDDGSTDNTKKVIAPYLIDSRVKYLYQENQGVTKARISGIKMAKGEYIALLDSDDFWIDNRKLEKQIEFLEKNPEYVLTSGGIIRGDEKGREFMRTLNPEKDEDIREAMLFSCLIAPSAAVFRKNAYEIAGGFDESTDLSEDWDLFLKMGKVGKMYNFQEYFLYYLQGSQNRSNFNRRENLKYNISLIKKYAKDYPHIRKAIWLHRFYYLYSFFPFKDRLLPLFSIIKRLIFGKPAYRSKKIRTNYCPKSL